MDFQKWWAQQGHGLWRDDKAITPQVARAAWAAATEAERERCAKLCEEIAREKTPLAAALGADDCATAIRRSAS